MGVGYWVLAGTGLLIVVPALVMDIRARRRGHRFRDSGSMSADVSDLRRDLRAGRASSWFDKDTGWTAETQRNRRGTHTVRE